MSLAFLIRGADSGTPCLSLPGKPVDHVNIIINVKLREQ